jgi:FtsP/CotA-like multicopper oxidase with cupredoxin domain
MNPVKVHDRRPPTGAGTGRALLALLLTVGVIVGWWIVPPEVLGGSGRPGPHGLAVTILVMAPVALLAAAGGGWLARRRGWLAAGRRGVLTHAAATAGLFALLSLVTAPLQRAVFGWLSPLWGPPNLAAIRYDSAAVQQSQLTMLHHDGASAEELAAINAPFYPSLRPGFNLDYALQDALFLFATAAPLVVLGLFLTNRLGSGTAPRRLAVPTWIRPRWAAAGAAFVLAIVGTVVIAPTARAAVVPFTQPLNIPPVLTGSNITIDMRQTNVKIMPTGPLTRMWTYNGIFPGPTIRRPSGTTTRVTFRNNLPSTFGSATIHHHGSHSRSTEDGQPNSQLIPPVGQRTYSYEHFEEGLPERAVTQWYHDHRMNVTGRNVWNGLAGFFILDDAFDSALPLPKGEFDVPLMIAERSFDANNQIPYTFNINPGTQGNTFLVNGVPQPFFNVGDRKYRFRVLNANNRSPVILALSNGAPMIQIGTDSGLLPAPVSRTQILMQPAERVEIVVDFAGMLGQNVNLINANPAGIPPPDMMQFRVNRDVNETSSVPATLRPVPTFPTPVRDRQFVIGVQRDAAGNIAQWQFNGQPFDSARFDADPVLGTTERWTFFNNSPSPHGIHIHDVDWRLVSRFTLAFDASGNPIPGTPLPVAPEEDALKETWSIPANQGFSVVTTFTDNTGPYVFHCHMLEHEDMALMAQFNVHT